jgi:hypothetical protein
MAGAAAVLGAHFLGHGGGTPAASGHGSKAGVTATGSPSVFGIPTVTAGCPAASVLAGARCPSHPECWAGMVEISGAVTDRRLPCTRPHYWETFAIAILPADARSFDQPALEKNPAVNAVLGAGPARLAARPGPADSVERVAGRRAAAERGRLLQRARTYRCVANVPGRQPRTSQFRR